ncbi:penicillin-binding protein 2 [Altererythrobacter sp. KTW20L]|uniref:penicillin-binding protein 2 n=1 Tax=Altererythrobacter sp. KTW20L TaxID=2942210 RepID=UPI0020C1503C|nr:penicillin-binding protein 2 [Altererythrobacter sp. KTW20L]MCL6251107.1 penicillin-binding protein 2 [Altererythrobacter sp. KTW20L]
MEKAVSSNALKQTFDRRTFVIGAAQAGVGLLLAARMGYIAVAENEKYRMEAESNRVNLSLIPPRRGWILDREGSPLASNRADFRVDIIPERLEDIDGTVRILGDVLAFTPAERQDLHDRLEEARGFSAVPVASGLDYDSFAAVSVRLPELPGVIPQRGYSRYYPTGPAVGHLLGYVGAANREEFDLEPVPLLLTPGFKLGKDGVEKQFEQVLRGQPGARRVEVTARGRIVRDLETREDIQGNPVQLTIDGPLQDYAARRLGLESGSAVVIDCETGDLLCAASMPSFDPNSFSEGIGRVEYQMLREDERVPLRNKVLSGLYPPGSTLKPMAGMALLEAGIDPQETVNCPGGYRLGNRVFRCLGRHGPMTMHTAIARSCNTYFYAMAHRHGYEIIAAMGRSLGLGERYELPVASQSYGTVPDAAWKMRRFEQQWTHSDSLNAVIGQGYMIASPLQLAVMSACLASGKHIRPRLVLGEGPEPGRFSFDPAHFETIRLAMSEVVNGAGTAGRSRLPFPDILMGGKTGTAQVRGLGSGGRGGMGVPWRFRDHGLFVFFAPVDRPKYAGAVVIEHGLGGSVAAAPVARDVLTYLFDPQKGLDVLHALEAGWGGTAQERLAKTYAQYASAAAGIQIAPTPRPPNTGLRPVDAEARAAASAPEADPAAGEALAT